MLKNEMNSMLCLDLYLSTITASDYEKLPEIVVRKNNFIPLLGYGLATSFNTISNSEKSSDSLKLQQFKKQFHWNSDIDQLLNQSYDALVVTDSDQSILWVNQGFTKMTGYSKKYAVGKKPNFLQGKNTNVSSRNSIRRKIKNFEIITTKLINYRKNNEEYLCEVTIVPLFNKDFTTAHFIALEREIVF
jgi:PAS domain S-box-containing protein